MDQQWLDILQRLAITYPIFLFSLTIHEVAHAITAKWGGDLTAAYQGRVSLLPTTHIDPLGTVVMPIMGAVTGIPVIGWARPVPVNSMNFRRGDNYDLVVTLAGPFSNLLIALFAIPAFQLYIISANIFPQLLPTVDVMGDFFFFLFIINMALMFFNLLPLPPLDGSHVFYRLVVHGRPSLYPLFDFMWQYSMIILVLLLISGFFGAYLGMTAVPAGIALYGMAFNLLP